MNLDTIVIGAGLAGLTAARELVTSGQRVLVLDKGRGHGGRLSRKTLNSTEVDHGAQYFTARTSQFLSEVRRWVTEGAAARWRPRVVHLGGGNSTTDEDEWFVGTPAMNSICRLISAGLDVRFSHRVMHIGGARHARSVSVEELGTIGPARNVIVTAPAPQTAELIGSVAADLAIKLASLKMQPCWAVMLAFEHALPVEFDAAFVGRSNPIRWIARNSSKPGRPTGDSWVIHADPLWSAEMFEVDSSDVIDQLVGAMAELIQHDLKPGFAAAHRWRYARTATPLGRSHMGDESTGIFVAGDWCLGSRLEAAFRSGLSVANALKKKGKSFSAT